MSHSNLALSTGVHLAQEGKLDPTFVITHHLPLDAAERGYKIFNDKEEGCMKVVLNPGASQASATER